MTGYASIDKPWLKYYSDEAINSPLPELTMYQYIWENNKDYLSNNALRYYGTKITYGRLFENIRKAANAFYSMGIRAGDVVTIMSMHTPETIYSFYALNYIGAVANMVYMTLSEEEISQSLRETESKIFLFLETATDRVIRATIPISVQIISLPVSRSMPFPIKQGYRIKNRQRNNSFIKYEKFISDAIPMLSCSPAQEAHSPAIIVYTSGTTGEPKGVVLSSYNINSVIFQYNYSGIHFGRRERYLGIMPLFLAYGVTMLQLALFMGLETTLCIIPEPKEIAKAFQKTRPNHFTSGPAMLDDIMKNVTGNMSYLINFTGGGAALSKEKEEQLNHFLKAHNCHVKYIIGYGMTELSATVCTNSNQVYKQGSLGIPLPKSTAKIVEPDSGNELKKRMTGEICFNSPSIMLGYYKNSTATNKVISIDENGQAWIHTGDLGYIDEDGFLFYQGKIKRIFACRTGDGLIMKLFPQRIEELFETAAAVDKCAVIVREDPVYLNTALAYVTIKSSFEGAKSELIEELSKLAKTSLPEHSRPASIQVVDEFSLTVSGKVDYRSLEKLAEETQQA